MRSGRYGTIAVPPVPYPHSRTIHDKGTPGEAVVDSCVTEKPDKLVRATWISAVTYPSCFVFRTDNRLVFMRPFSAPLNGPLA
jgi:hypothetical protein